MLGLTAVSLVFLLTGIVSYMNTRKLNGSAGLVSHTYEVLSVLEQIISLVKDAETGQRGFLLTGDERYLGPYNAANQEIEKRLGRIEKLVEGNAELKSLVPGLRAAIAAKSQELAQTIEIRRKGGRNSVGRAYERNLPAGGIVKTTIRAREAWHGTYVVTARFRTVRARPGPLASPAWPGLLVGRGEITFR